MICEYVSPEEREQIMKKVNAAMMRGASNEELDEIGWRIPILPCLAHSLKETIGLDALLHQKLNLYDAVQEYGEEFIRK